MKIFNYFLFLCIAQVVFSQTQNHVVFPTLNVGTHTGRIEGLFTIPEKKQIISVGEEGIIRTMSVETGEVLQINSIQKENCGTCQVFATALSPDKQTLAIGGYLSKNKNEIWFIDLKTWTLQQVLDGHEEGVKALAYSRSGEWLVSGGQKGDIKVWSTTDFKSKILTQKHQGGIIDLAVSQNADFFISAGKQGKFFLWKQSDNGSYIAQSLEGHPSIPLSVAIASDDEFIVSADIGGKLIAWDQTGKQLWSSATFLPTTKPLGAISIAPNNQWIAFKEDHFLQFKVHILDATKQKLLNTISYHKNTVLETAFYDNESIISANGGGVEIFKTNWQDQQIQQQWITKGYPISKSKLKDDLSLILEYDTNLERGSTRKGSVFSFRNLSLKPILKEILVTNRNHVFKDKKLKKINAHSLQIMGGNTIHFVDSEDGRIQDFFFTEEGQIFVVGDFVIKEFDKNGQLLYTYQQYVGELRTATVTDDGRYLCISGTDQITKIYNLKTRELLASLFIEKNNQWVLWSPAGYYAASNKNTDLLAWFQNAEQQLPQFIKNGEAIVEQFYRPELLKRIIVLGALDKALQQSNASFSPIIRLSKIEDTSRLELYPLKFIIETPSPLNSLEIYRNGKLVYSKFQFDNRNFIQTQAPLTLTRGDNQLQIIAKSENGQVAKIEKKIFYDTSPEIVLSSGHTKGSLNLAFSPDGKYFASASLDNTLKIWNINGGVLHQTFDLSDSEWEITSGIGGVLFHPTDANKVCVFNSNKLYIIDTRNGQLIQELYEKNILSLKSPVKGIAYSLDGEQLFSVAMDGYLRCWSTQTYEQEYRLKIHTKAITALAISKDGKYLFTKGADSCIKVFDIHKREIIKEISYEGTLADKEIGHGLGDFVAISPDNNKIAVGGMYQDRLEVFAINTGKKLYETLARKDQITGASFTLNSQYLAVSFINKPIQIIKAALGELMQTFSQESTVAQTLRFHPNQDILVSSHGIMDNFALRVWQVPEGKLLLKFGGNKNGINCMDISPNQRYLAVSGVDKNLWIWDLQSLQLKTKIPVGNYCLDILGTYDVAFNAEGNLVAVASCDDVVRIFDLPSDSVIVEKKFSIPISALVFHPKKDFLALAENDIQLWNLETHNLEQLGAHQGNINQLKFSKDGAYLSAISEQELSVWNVVQKEKIASHDVLQSNQKVRTAKNISIIRMLDNSQYIDNYCLAYANDNKFLVYSGALTGAIIKYNIKTKATAFIQEKALLPGKYIALAISPDNNYLAAGKVNDGLIEIFDLQNKQIIKTLSGHNGAVNRLFFDKKGKYIYSSGKDGQIKIWNWKQSKEIINLSYSSEGNYTFTTNDYFYYSNRLGWGHLNFMVNGQLFPFEQFDLLQNRPDVVLSRLPQADNTWIKFYKKAHDKRREKMGFREKDLGLDFSSIPTVQLEHSLNTDIVKDKKYQFAAIVQGGQQQPIKRLHVYVNDVPLYGRKGLEYQNNRTTIRENVTIDLSQGRNKIQISAINQNGVESLKETFYRTYQSNNIQKPDLHIIAIGVNEYDTDRTKNLNYPEKDAIDISEFFQRRKDNFGRVKTHLILGENFNLNRLNILKGELQKTKVDDVVIVFYAGHGTFDAKQNYFLTAKTTDLKNPVDGGIPYERFEDLLDEIPARKKLLLIDACHSGEIDKEETILVQNDIRLQNLVVFRSLNSTPQPKNIGLANSFELMKQLFVDLRRGTGATVISSAGGGEFARESEKWNNSVFTYCLLSGLTEDKLEKTTRKADLNGDRQITISELQQYLAVEVLKETKGHQRPTMRIENISNDWKVWSY